MNRRSAVKAEPRVAAQSPQQGLGVGYLLGRARGSLLAGLDAELERFGLTGMQFGVLKHLAEGAAHTAAELCRRMHYDTGSMTRILDRLEEKGLVRRERGREDRRLMLLRIAPGGRVLLPRLMAVAARVLEGHLAGFNAAEIEALKDYLGRMIDNGQANGDNEHSPTGGRS
jgi:MarR family transcriptional regulator, multiple antibiotic resistance protein MarR